MPAQVRNSEMIGLQQNDLVSLSDPLRAIVNINSFILGGANGLAAYWPMNLYNPLTNTTMDLAPIGNDLTLNAGVGFGYQHIGPAMTLGSIAATGYLSRASASAQSLVLSNQFTFGGWWRKNSVADGIQAGMISKHGGTAGTKSYTLFWVNTTLYLIVSGDGSTDIQLTYSLPMAANTWYNVIARYLASNEIAIFVNGVKVATRTTTIPATLFNTATEFRLGSMNAGTTFTFAGLTCYDFVSRFTLPDNWIRAYYELSRPIFNI